MHRVHSRVPTPLPVPDGRTPVLLMGGSFDPPHRAHIELALAARDHLWGDRGWAVLIPSARSPHKDHPPGASGLHRVQMLRLASQDVPRMSVWTDELDRGDQPSYWVDTVRRCVAQLLPGTPCRTLLGSDQALAFGRWRDPGEIQRLAPAVVALRPPHATREQFLRALGPVSAEWVDRVLPWAARDVSATRVRELLAHRAQPLALAELRTLLHPAVLDYILDQGLYGPNA